MKQDYLIVGKNLFLIWSLLTFFTCMTTSSSRKSVAIWVNKLAVIVKLHILCYFHKEN